MLNKEVHNEATDNQQLNKASICRECDPMSFTKLNEENISCNTNIYGT